MSVIAQTTTTDEKQEPAQQQGKAKVEQTTKAGQQKLAPRRAPAPNEQINVQERSGTTERQGARSSAHEGARINEQGGTVSHATTVFQNGRETSEHLAVRRSVREQNDVHFGIGTHPRDWWLRSYSIVLMDGCHYYLADNGCWYPAYGFDPSCNYAPGVVYCE